ncbi:MAG TPA: hypothetical protein VEJ38_10620 [Candidatus Acidoferrales bacterium]|nr:hypothetical protein [Candidatus Acidoferrales bacterium]
MDVVAIPSRQTFQTELTEGCIAERRLWLAVVTLAVEDWRSGTLRARREAQKFIFDDYADFESVCSRAGLDPESLRSKLSKIGRKVELTGPWSHPIAA